MHSPDNPISSYIASYMSYEFTDPPCHVLATTPETKPGELMTKMNGLCNGNVKVRISHHPDATVQSELWTYAASCARDFRCSHDRYASNARPISTSDLGTSAPRPQFQSAGSRRTRCRLRAQYSLWNRFPAKRDVVTYGDAEARLVREFVGNRKTTDL